MAHDLFFKKTTLKNYSRIDGSDFVGIVSSSVARATADQLLADVENLNDRISQWYKTVAALHSVPHGNFVNAWMRFRDVTYKAIEDSKRTWNPEFASSIVERLNIMQGNLKGWVSQFEKTARVKYGVLSTDLVKPPEDKGTSPWVYVVVGLGSVVVVGGVMGYFILPKLLVGGAAAGASGMLGGAR